MSSESEALARAQAERELLRRIDENIFALLQAGHEFSPAGLVVNNKTSLDPHALTGYTETPQTHELTDVVVGDIVVADPEVNLQPYLDVIQADVKQLAELTHTPLVLIDDDTELCAMAPYAEPDHG